jgi:hypothetical protein
MGALAASDVAVVLAQQDRDALGISQKISFPRITFGDGVKTYPSGGIPLPDFRAFGFLKGIKRFLIQQPPNGYVYKYDAANNKLMIFQGVGGSAGASVVIPNHTHDVKLIGGITATEPVAVQGGDTLGKNAATDRTIAGADSATKGGVVAAALSGTVNGTSGDAGPLTELANTVAPAATSLDLLVIGV